MWLDAQAGVCGRWQLDPIDTGELKRAWCTSYLLLPLLELP